MKTETKTQRTQITHLDPGELGAIEIEFECRYDGNNGCGSQGVRNNAWVDIYFLTEAGIPVCPDCDENMDPARGRVVLDVPPVSLF